MDLFRYILRDIDNPDGLSAVRGQPLGGPVDLLCELTGRNEDQGTGEFFVW